MDISALLGLSSQDYETAVLQKDDQTKSTSTGFDTILAQAMNMVTETNEFQNKAESAEIQFALGESTSTHELLVAQEKANIALTYTVAVRDKVIEAYKEIMNMQI